MKSLGEKLRGLRKERGLSLKEASAAIGCSPSYLSMVENNKLDPSISRLKKIAEGLGSTIVDLFREPQGQEVIVRKGKRPLAAFPRSRLRIEILVPQGPEERKLDARLAVVAPGGGSEGDYSHEGQEFGFVMAGSMELTIEGNTYLLNEGDSFYFESAKGHRWRNPGQEECQILWVNYPPSW